MAKEFKMSQARYDELKQELDYSKTTRADEVAELIKEARGFGDLSENSEYDEAKNEQGKPPENRRSYRRAVVFVYPDWSPRPCSRWRSCQSPSPPRPR